MTITTDVRINWPVPAVALLDHVTTEAGGDPATVRRHVEPGSVRNAAGQGLRTLAWVRWSEQPDHGDEDYPRPEALVVLSIDNPYGGGPGKISGAEVQANEILPAVVEWLDAQGVPRTSWWWEDECRGTWHPGTVDVAHLLTGEAVEKWRAA